MPRIAARVLMVCLLSLPTAAFAGNTVFPLTGPPDFYVANLDYTINYTGADATSLNLTGSTVILPDNDTLAGGAVEALGDVPGTPCYGVGGAECQLGGLAIAFTADSTGFTITGQTIAAYDSSVNYFNLNPLATEDPTPADNATTTYLSGTFIPSSFVQQLNSMAENPDGEYGELFTVTAEDFANMNLLEQTFPSIRGATGGATNLVGDTVFFDFDAVDSNGDMEPLVPTPEPASLTLLCTGLAAGLLRKRLARKRA